METGWELIRLELKYCERCGGLWMRTRGSHDVYCALCVLQLKEFPAARGRRKSRALINDRIEITGQRANWPEACGGGNV